MKTLIFAFVLFCFTILIFPAVNGTEFDPYEVLEVGRRSSADEIRKKYKKLAREW